MSVRQDVFKFMESHPKAPLTEVISNFPDVKETTIRRYYFESLKATPKKTSKKATSQKSKPTKSKGNLKQQINEHLSKHPDCELKDLYQAFPDAQKGTVANYRRQWLKTASTDTEEISADKKREILDFLDRNPSLNIADLKKAFPEAVNKVVTIFRSWKASQTPQAEPPHQETITADKKTNQQKVDPHQDTIAHQKKIIEQQKTKIAALKSQLPNVKGKGVVSSIKNFIMNRLTKR